MVTLERHLQAMDPQMEEPYSRLGFLVGDRPSFGRALRADMPIPPEYWGCRDTIYVVGNVAKLKKVNSIDPYKHSLARNFRGFVPFLGTSSPSHEGIQHVLLSVNFSALN